MVFGATTTRGPGDEDVLNALTCVTPLDRYAEKLRVYVKDSTTPPVPGVDVQKFADPADPNRGVVVVYIPFSDGAPFRAEGPKGDVNGKYFMRTTSDTVVMPHQILAAMFGRRPPPPAVAKSVRALQLDAQWDELVRRHVSKGLDRSAAIRAALYSPEGVQVRAAMDQETRLAIAAVMGITQP